MDTNSKFAILAVLAMALVAFVPIMAEASDATGEPDLSIYRYTPKLTMTSDNFGAVKYIVWDFGDGTVLDGRWEYYVEKQDNGETLSAEIIAGINAYKALLAENGNSLIVTTHTYALKGTYTATAVAMNPLGYVPEGGTAYDNLSSADFVVGDFPFHEFVQHISGKSSYEMIQGIKEFYDSLEPSDEAPSGDGRMTEKEFITKFYPKLKDEGVTQTLLCKVFKHDRKTLEGWVGKG